MVENGKYDFFTSGIKKYKIDHYAFLGPALTIAGNGATVGYMHYADGFFNAYQRTYVLTELLGDRTFLFSTINRKLQKKIQQEARAGNIPYIVLDMLTELDIYLPSLEEQIQIGNFFKQLDDTIALHQGTLEKYQKLKVSYLEKMFPKENELYPELRFPNFTDAWEQCKLGDVVNIIMGQSPDSKNYTNNSSDHILVQGNADIKNGFVYPRVWTTQITKQGHSGDLIMSVRAPVGDIAKTEYDVVLGRGVCAIKGNEFIFQLLTKMKENDYWESLSTGSTFDSINSNDIKNAEIFIPSLEEQTQIGNFFKQLDDTIALHQREFEKFKILRKAYLKHIFIDDTTQFRAEKTIPWEQRKLGEFVSSLRSGLSRMLDSEDIGLPVIRANNINNGYVDLENDIKYWYQIDPMGANTRNYLVAKDDILINFINSESRMGSAAIMRSIPSRDTIYTTNILRLRLTSDLDPYWFYIQTQSKLYLEYIKSISKVAVNQASFTTVEFKNFTFFCPSTKEQTQIGNFFKQLDDTIALHQKELAKYQQIKTACLEKMFVE